MSSYKERAEKLKAQLETVTVSYINSDNVDTLHIHVKIVIIIIIIHNCTCMCVTM